MSIVTLYEK